MVPIDGRDNLLPMQRAYWRALAESAPSWMEVPLFGGIRITRPGPAVKLLSEFVRSRCWTKMLADDVSLRLSPISWTITLDAEEL